MRRQCSVCKWESLYDGIEKFCAFVTVFIAMVKTLFPDNLPGCNFACALFVDDNMGCELRYNKDSVKKLYTLF